jgi:hypothetical protein
MKECAYCGRENADEAEHCRECGTQFVEQPVPKGLAEPRDRTWQEWLGRTLRAVGIVLAVGLLYLLSFGPVVRYFGKTTTLSQPTVTSSVKGQAAVLVSVRSVSYPVWVGIVYRPAFMMRENRYYEEYLRWWEERS